MTVSTKPTTSFGTQSITYNPPSALGQSVSTTDPSAQEMSFLQLLVSEISNQSPDSPMDPTAMITQYSQMESSIGLIKLNSSSVAYQNSAIAASLMDKNVTVNINDGSAAGTNTVSGTVTGIDFSGTVPALVINGSSYPLTDVAHVGA